LQAAKSPATSAATSLLFLTGAITNFVYLTLVEELGVLAFVGFSCIAAGSALYVWRRVPETRGKTQAEVQALLSPDGGAGLAHAPAQVVVVQQQQQQFGWPAAQQPAVVPESGLVEMRQLMANRPPGETADGGVAPAPGAESLPAQPPRL
jgi:hypothetical protein